MAAWHPAGWQTLGPFFNDRFVTPADADLPRRTPDGPLAEGEPIEIEGAVYRIQGEPHRDVLVEIWQANHHGKYDHSADRRNLPVDPNFKGFGRLLTERNTSGPLYERGVQYLRDASKAGDEAATERLRKLGE